MKFLRRTWCNLFHSRCKTYTLLLTYPEKYRVRCKKCKEEFYVKYLGFWLGF